MRRHWKPKTLESSCTKLHSKDSIGMYGILLTSLSNWYFQLKYLLTMEKRLECKIFISLATLYFLTWLLIRGTLSCSKLEDRLGETSWLLYKSITSSWNRKSNGITNWSIIVVLCWVIRLNFLLRLSISTIFVR